jgi:hypothetical protein
MQKFSKKTQMGDPHGRSSTAERLILNWKFKKQYMRLLTGSKHGKMTQKGKEKGKDLAQDIKV